MRAPAFLALALGLLAASVPTWASQPAPAVAHTLHQGPCEEQFAAFPVPMAEAQAVAPPGFPPLPFDGERTVPPIPLLGTEVTVGYRCAATTSDDGLALGEVRTLGRALVVNPPPEDRDPSISDYVIVFGGTTSSPDLAALFRSWDLPGVEAGEVDFAVSQDAPVLRHGTVHAASASGTLDLATVAAGVEDAQQPDAFRLFVFQGGALAGWIDWSWPAGARTIESGAAVQLAQPAGGAPLMATAGVSFHYYGAYFYDLTFHPRSGS